MKIGFAKSFKVSGSTVADILLRISYFYGIFFDMKTESMVFMDKESTAYGNISEFNIFVEDTLWNFDNVKNILGNNFISLTIMRDPIYQFESMFHFMHMQTHYNVSSFEKFLEKLASGDITNKRFQVFGRNQLAYTLGFEDILFEDNTAVTAFIKDIDQRFSLVMISEYFEESVIILKKILGTQIGQMAFVPLLVRTNEVRHKFSGNQKVLLEKWLNVDIRLYNTCKRSLERRFTKQIREEAQMLKKINKKLQTFCKVKHFSSSSYGTYKIEVQTTNRSNLFCDLYLGHYQLKFRLIRRAVKDAGELQRLF